jgi:uncharacterized DUF497 family protein
MAAIDKASGFDWDEANRSHCQKHGMEPNETESMFATRPIGALTRCIRRKKRMKRRAKARAAFPIRATKFVAAVDTRTASYHG